MRGFRFIARCLAAVAALWLGVCGCAAPPQTAAQELSARNETHIRMFGDFDLPRKIGAVENVGLQVPAVSPDGRELLYLRSDVEPLSLMTVLGSNGSEHTPPEGSLEIWIRPLAGTSAGARLSRGRWAHSAAWSNSGTCVAYVTAAEKGTAIVVASLADGVDRTLGVPGAVNCMPRFDGDDTTVLFCSGPSPAGPFRVYRQSSGEPVAVTPEGMDCLLPVMTDNGSVICATPNGAQLDWIVVGPTGSRVLDAGWGTSDRPALLQTWAGIASPVSPGRRSFLFFDQAADRIAIWHSSDHRLRRHRSGSIAACWLSEDAVALATSEYLFAVDTISGMSLSLFNGLWLPARYVERERRLIVFGRASPRRLSIQEIVFRTRAVPKDGSHGTSEAPQRSQRDSGGRR